jgi:hypothetical protein
MEPAVLKKEKRAITFFGSLHGDLVPAKIAMQDCRVLDLRIVWHKVR